MKAIARDSRRPLRRWLVVVVAVIITAVASGCGSSGSTDSATAVAKADVLKVAQNGG